MAQHSLKRSPDVFLPGAVIETLLCEKIIDDGSEC